MNNVQAPVKEPVRIEPDIDPDRRLDPDRLCPGQKREVVRDI